MVLRETGRLLSQTAVELKVGTKTGYSTLIKMIEKFLLQWWELSVP